METIRVKLFDEPRRRRRNRAIDKTCWYYIAGIERCKTNAASGSIYCTAHKNGTEHLSTSSDGERDVLEFLVSVGLATMFCTQFRLFNRSFDFYTPLLRLIVEWDGGYHDPVNQHMKTLAGDVEKDGIIKELGYYYFLRLSYKDKYWKERIIEMMTMIIRGEATEGIVYSSPAKMYEKREYSFVLLLEAPAQHLVRSHIAEKKHEVIENNVIASLVADKIVEKLLNA